MIVAGAENRPPMLDKTIPLVYLTIEENGQIHKKKYAELTKQEKLQDDCDAAKDIWDRVKLLMQCTKPSYQERECKLYNEFDKFTLVKGDDLIACLNKAMAFMSTIMASCFPSTNNQLRTSFNPRSQATIQNGRVTIKQVQGRQGQSFASTGNKGNATSSKGNNVAGQARFKEKMLLVQAQESGQVLDEEQLALVPDIDKKTKNKAK
ncbi:hypothetical protein Tco_0309716 [Tanacetum coccineum]